MAKKLFTSLASNGLSVLSRLAAGVLIFIGLGRFLPPIEFGLFSYWVGVATIIAVIGDFGCSTRVLRDLAAAGESAPVQYANLARLRFTVSLILFVLSTLVIGVFYRSEAVVALVLILTLLIAAAGEYCSNALRALGKFQQESRISSANNLLTASAVIACAYFGVTVAAIAYLLSRLLGYWQLNRATNQAGLMAAPKSNVFDELTQSISFAVDNFITILATSFDVILVRQFSGLNAVANYQAISKIISGFFVVAQVFAGVFIPKIALSNQRSVDFYRLLAVFFAASMSFAVSLCLLAEFIGGYVYNNKFGDFESLVVPFAVYLVLRFCAAAFGVFLTAIGRQKIRAIGNGASLLIMLSASYVFIPTGGYLLMPCILSLGSLILIVFYSYVSYKSFNLNGRVY